MTKETFLAVLKRVESASTVNWLKEDKRIGAGDGAGFNVIVVAKLDDKREVHYNLMGRTLSITAGQQLT